MSERLIKLGVAKEFWPIARDFIRAHPNMSRAQQDRLIKAGVEFRGKPADMQGHFRPIFEEVGLTDDDMWLGDSWLSGFHERGEQQEALTFSPADERRISEIQEEMKGGKYWSDPDMRDEYARLLQAQESGTHVSTTSTRPGGDANRKAEIERLMVEDRAKYFSSGADKEYLGLLQQETAESVGGNLNNDGVHEGDAGNGGDGGGQTE